MDENKLAEERGAKLLHFIKTKSSLVAYAVLAILVWLSVHIRSANLSGLRDITTGGWTLGPDLDPFLFLRWAKYIVAHGTLYALDTMRNVPLGFNTKEELLLHPYMIAWFHKIAVFFGSTSVDQSAALYPVFFFAITVIAFFFMTRKIFFDSMGELKSNIIALVSSFFLIALPALVPRTIAGIPEKESAGFFFLFLAFYLFLSAWKSKSFKWQLPLAILSGIATAMMSLVWGGYIFIFVAIGLSVTIAFFLGQVNLNKFGIYSAWLFSAFIIMMLSSSRYTIGAFLSSETTLSGIIPFMLIGIHLLIFNTPLKKYAESEKLSKIPKQIISLIALIVLGGIASSVVFGPLYIFDRAHNALDVLVTPTTDRLGVTVAENRQPYFTEWAGSFGPYIKSFPVLFWLFFLGSIYLFSHMLKSFGKKERLILTASYVVFLVAVIFSRYSGESLFNGTNGISIMFYLAGVLVLIAAVGYYYYKYSGSEHSEKLKSVNFNLIFIFSLFFFSIVAARGAVRLIMVLVPTAAIISSYFAVASLSDARKITDKTYKIVAIILALLICSLLVFSGYVLYKQSYATAQVYIPSSYSQQWQKAMSWVRESTPVDAVFGHWWDYGYWLQSIGDRATVLDGGNSIPYWNHLMGRYALTGTDNAEALSYLYSHNTTHFLIDSSDIGKYSAFSSIGSDENYDRLSWLPIFQRNNQQTQETSNSTIYLFSGGTALDSDIIYDNNGQKVFLPGNKAGIGAVIVQEDASGNITHQPEGIFIYNGVQYRLPLRYAYKSSLIDFGSGVEAGVFLFPRLSQSSTGTQFEDDGALIYLSNRTVKSQLARLYLYKENNPNFQLVHSEDDFVVAQVKSQGLSKNDFVLYGELRGPIRIWQINYPAGMKVNPVYVQPNFPASSNVAK